MLLGRCAEDVVKSNTLWPNAVGIELGAEKKYFTQEVLSTLRTVAAGVDMNYGIKEFVMDDYGCTWQYYHVPISLQIIHRKYSFFQNLDFAWYKAEEYKVPNPFQTYWKSRFLIK